MTVPSPPAAREPSPDAPVTARTGGPETCYHGLDFAQATGWDEFEDLLAS